MNVCKAYVTRNEHSSNSLHPWSEILVGGMCLMYGWEMLLVWGYVCILRVLLNIPPTPHYFACLVSVITNTGALIAIRKDNLNIFLFDINF